MADTITDTNLIQELPMQLQAKIDRATQIHAELVELAGPIITDYRNDLLVHDYDAIRNNNCEPFVHATYDSATHYWHIPHTYTHELIPIAFGKQKHWVAVRNQLSALRYISSQSYVWHYFNGDTIKRVSADQAIEAYVAGIRKADAQLLQSIARAECRSAVKTEILQANREYECVDLN